MENEYDIEFDFSDSSDNSDYSSDDSGTNETQENEANDSEVSFEGDYSSTLSDIYSGVTDLNSEVIYLHETVNTLNDNVVYLSCFTFIILIYLVIRCGYHIITSILGLGSC